ncbi:MAG: glycerophosphoryl diester phosphodiesterase, partial [Candidatus Binatota bacterium]|nr:glycerophosphoryl diester phosphodiesterase [Candidatus Binatota bacterium]
MAGDYFAGPRPRIFGHRGAAGVAPENTLASFQRALDDGAEILELDVHATRDGEVVVIHDPTVDRTTDGHGAVRDLTLADLGRLDAGHAFLRDGGFPFRGSGIRVPTLAEVIDEFPTVPLNVEIKQREPEIEAVVAALVARRGAMKRVMLA